MTEINKAPFQMRVLPKVDAKDPAKRIARVHAEPEENGGTKELNQWIGMLCFFDKKLPQPAPGVGIDVMITGLLWNRTPDGNYFDYSRAPKGLFVREVTADDMLVHHKGFECSGSMCSTTAIVADRSRKDMGGCYTLTPGRLNGTIREVDNVNSRFLGIDSAVPIPGVAFVSREHLRTAGGICRIEGVPNILELKWPHTAADAATEAARMLTKRDIYGRLVHADNNKKEGA
jgi:hypothetical protein